MIHSVLPADALRVRYLKVEILPEALLIRTHRG
jgi:hypothetical protein